MKPNNTWIKDWMIGENPSKEKRLGKDFLDIFNTFWIESDLDNKSKSTMNRYSGALHALGGHLVEKGLYEETNMTSMELLLDNISEFEGPLIHHHNEAWQNELDMVSKKLCKHIKSS